MSSTPIAELANKSQQGRPQPNSDDGGANPLLMHSIMWANFKVLTNPLDRMKILLQAHLETCSSLTPHERNLLSSDLGTFAGTSRHLMATEGFHGLWRGSGLAWASSFLHSMGSLGVMWWVDWMTKPQVGYAAYDRNRDGNIIRDENPDFWKRAVYSGVGGFGLSLLLYPFDMVRMVRMADLKFPQAGRVSFQHPTLFHFFSELRSGRYIFRTVPRSMLEDVNPNTMTALRHACLWRGYALSLLGMMMYRAIHLFLATTCINVALRSMQNPDQGPSALQELAIGFGVTMGATTAMYPIDTLRARFIRLGFGQSPMVGGGEYLPVKDLIHIIWQREGIAGFYRGAKFALTMRAFTVAGAAFGVPMFTNWMIGSQNPLTAPGRVAPPRPKEGSVRVMGSKGTNL